MIIRKVLCVPDATPTLPVHEVMAPLYDALIEAGATFTCCANRTGFTLYQGARRTDFAPGDWALFNRHGVFKVASTPLANLTAGARVVGVVSDQPGDIWDAVIRLRRPPRVVGAGSVPLEPAPGQTEPAGWAMGTVYLYPDTHVWQVLEPAAAPTPEQETPMPDPHDTEMTTREELVTAALTVLRAERGDETHGNYGDDVDYARDQLAHAARAHTAAVDALPCGDNPVGWHATPDAPQDLETKDAAAPAPVDEQVTLTDTEVSLVINALQQAPDPEDSEEWGTHHTLLARLHVYQSLQVKR